MQACTLERLLWQEKAVRLGNFKLSSGRISRIYIDLRYLISSIHARQLILVSLAFTGYPSLSAADVIAGVATAGIPWAAWLAMLFAKPLAYIRRTRKDHGAERLVEGRVENKRVVIIDDVATTGSSLVAAAKAVRVERGTPLGAVVVVDRCGEASKNFETAIGAPLSAVTSLATILECGVREGFVEKHVAREILAEECRESIEEGWL